ncbi:hypothetical protein KKA17_04755 [bacterium]|nr:hypothetical protein [bacterium]MBU1884294.1 hypothetical protein [bacterium]
MLELIIKHKVILSRSVGIFLIIIGIVALFWSKPEKVLTENEIAEANIARMEASLPKNTVSSKKETKSSPFMKAYKDKQKEHIRYLVIVLIISGIAFFGYSFIKKKE